jgi:hypothetical protein
MGIGAPPCCPGWSASSIWRRLRIVEEQLEEIAHPVKQQASAACALGKILAIIGVVWGFLLIMRNG